MGALNETVELLRFTTAGSVDDGKSTLIGRLLFDSKAVLDDQLDALSKSSQRLGREFDLALLTDGLTAEREQGITIDVAYRYFASERRRFIIADTPGHTQYTRNMVTGASTAQAAVVLVDARKGPLEQTRRHLIVADLLGIRHIAVAVNKLDMVGFSAETFHNIRQELIEFSAKLAGARLDFIPLSALNGDMVVARGHNLDWYAGPTLLEWLEQVPAEPESTATFRFPVQLVSRPQLPHLHDFRGYLGRVEAGQISVGDEIVVLPSRRRTRVTDIVTVDGSQPSARSGDNVTLLIADQLDISRGDVFAHPQQQPLVTREFEANLCWLDAEPLQQGRRYLLKHGTRTLKASVAALTHAIDITSGERVAAPASIEQNSIVGAVLQVQQPMVTDSYADQRSTGSFILIDEVNHHTLAAGTVTRVADARDPVGSTRSALQEVV